MQAGPVAGPPLFSDRSRASAIANQGFENPNRTIVEKIAREVTRNGAFTVIYFSTSEGMQSPRFPTSDYEHARIREIFLQDRAYPHVDNDFSRFGLT